MKKILLALVFIFIFVLTVIQISSANNKLNHLKKLNTKNVLLKMYEFCTPDPENERLRYQG